jgi:hypothetical protein
MTETGKFVSISSILSLVLIFLTAAVPSLQAQDFSLEATVSENRIFIGEQFTVSVEVRGSSMRGVSLPVLPRINGVGVLNSTPSRSTSISIVNGQTTTSTTYTFSLVAREQGNYTIPPISIEIDGETYTTNSIPIEIIERRNLSQGEGRQLPDIFLEIDVDDANPVPGQQIVASLNLYFKQGVEITSFQPTAGWRTDGFWKEELQNIRQPQAESVILNGVRYRKATLIRYALFPSRSGSFSLAEFPLNVGIRTQPQRNDPFGSFFGSGTNQRRVTVESEPVEITVRPLPAAQNAISLNAVGDLRVERRLNMNEVKTGETIELITKVEGTGNIPLVRRPGYNFPDGLDRYTPQESSNVERRGLNIRGEKTFTELIVARAPGTYTIPEERVAVYYPDGGRYKYITLPALSFEARPAPGAPVVTASTTAGSLTPINGLAVWHNQSARPLHQTTWFWILLAIPALAVFIGLQQKHYRHKLMTDSGFARAQRAVEHAKERISKARDAVENRRPKECYNFLHKAITGFITDKLDLPEAGFSDAELIEKVKEKDAGEALVKQLKGMLDKCATISYAPAGTADDQLADTDKTEKLVSELRKLL